MAGNEQATVYACKCLNVHLRSSPPPSTNTEPGLPPASEWTTVFVAQDDDVKIIYPHLTLRSRHRGPYIPDPTRCARYTTLTCLSCKTLVYRVHQAVLTDDEVNIREGPIVLKGWAETEVLRSSSGWIEVSAKDVLVGETAVNRQRALPQFSDLFGVVLPTASPSPSPSLTPESEPPSSTTQALPKYQLPPIPPIFPEPKSNRSLFAVLASISTRHSNAIRAQAEEYIDGIVKEKVEEIQRAEAQLKRSVQLLLHTYSDGVKKAEQEYYTLQGGPLSHSAAKESIPSSPPGSPNTPVFSGVPSSVIRDFFPMRVTPSSASTTNAISTSASFQRSSRSPASPLNNSLPRVSALSASLATSTFHHPRAQARDTTTDGASSSSASANRLHLSDTESLQSLQSASSATLTSPQEANHHVFQFRRNVNDDINTAASFRYFQLEEEMKKRENPPPTAQTSRAVAASVDRSSGKGKGRKLQDPQEAEQATQQESTSRNQSHSSKAKGKRKVVTFDVEVTTPTQPAHVPATNLDAEEMLFDIEDEPSDEQTRNLGSEEVILPLLDSASQQQSSSSRQRMVKRTSSGNHPLPLPLSSLRPASLPTAPPYIPLAPPVTVPSPIPKTTTAKSNSDNADTDTPTTASYDSEEASSITPTSNPIIYASSSSPAAHAHELDRARNANILNLVGASLPSHRGAWAGKDEKGVYETFLRGARAPEDNEDEDEYQDDQELYADDDEEDDEEDEEVTMTRLPASARARARPTWAPSSVPVGIPQSKGSQYKAPVLSLATYQPAAILSNNNDTHAVSSRSGRTSSQAIRRAAYAERDVERGIDPGVLDYVAESDREEEEDASVGVGADVTKNDEESKGGGEKHTGGASRAVNGTAGTTTTSRGRDRAHRILESQAKSGVPDDGMWRSLI
ncbi:hypothetical protein GYMLUDRAFT_36363 [Collybiopsis luxurians FD-317 M1]|nr:hypothetical protein GYMLUDRAFT_36363 [Collybiopsis luxurians FD-317 M1]